jgi:hypothetical protein
LPYPDATPPVARNASVISTILFANLQGVWYKEGVTKAPLSDEVLAYFRKHGSDGGKKGKAARMKKTTKKQRKAAARAGARARWKGHKKNP